ncbi:MAG: hypothetical protein HFH80_02700 [Lachnospiraceae bacterium]|nr:hypothetical protein [Lachnospiraceae bacterium]
MKGLKQAKELLALFIGGTIIAGSMLVVNAGSCNHGGETSAFYTYSTVTIGCNTVGSHQCYVGGKLTSCELYVYKYINYTKCRICGEEGQSYYSYGETMHQYNH